MSDTYSFIFYQIKLFCHEILLHFIGPFSLVAGIPYLILLITMLIIFRPLVKLISLILRSDLAELLPPADSIFTQLDDPDHVKNCIVV